MTREQNVVITAYLFITAVSAGIAFHKWSVFFMVGFGLAYVLKIVNAVTRKEGQNGNTQDTSDAY